MILLELQRFSEEVSMRKLLVVVLIFLFVLSCGKGRLETELTMDDLEHKEKEEDVFIIGHVPSANVIKVAQRFKPLCDYLKDEIGKTIKLKFRPDYTGIIEKMKEGAYDMVIVGPKAYVEARDQGAPYIAMLKPRRFGSSFYRSIIITRFDSRIKKIEDIKGKKFAFSDPKSTSGYSFPKVFLIQHGLIPNKDFKVFFAGEHDNVVLNVHRGEYDVGACYDDARKTVFKSNLSKVEELTIIAKTPDIPNEPYLIREDLLKNNKELVEKLKNALLKLDKIPEGKNILKSLGENIEGYDEAQDKDYDVVREAEKILKEYGN
ncbi:MAG: phosphate/phosphite/phosphonate ABC transporter substrate-binding protein [Candidatus Hydrogenedentota bacterium]